MTDNTQEINEIIREMRYRVLEDELEKLISSVKSHGRMILRDDPIGSYWEKDDGERKLVRLYADGDNYWAITTEELNRITAYKDKAVEEVLDRAKQRFHEPIEHDGSWNLISVIDKTFDELIQAERALIEKRMM